MRRSWLEAESEREPVGAPVFREIHGVADILDQEDEDFLNQKLADLELELLRIVDKKAYYMAKATSPGYVCDREFRLMFLRADYFNPKDAARRLVNHFDTKLELFGEELLGRDIRLSDLTDLEVESLRTGYYQLLPQRDSAGRPILFFAPGSNKVPIKCRCRYHWWTAMNLMRDVDTQKRGVVAVFYSVAMGMFNPQASLKLPTLIPSLPIRFVSGHACSDSKARITILSLVVGAVSRNLRTRFRFHYGTSC